MVLLRKAVDKINGIDIFDPNIDRVYEGYPVNGVDILNRVENNHFWFICRKARILTVVKKYISQKSSFLEMGAGTGNVSLEILKADYDVSVSDIYTNGLRYAKQYGIINCYQFDLFNPPFAEHFDSVGMFDVLEHLENDLLALQMVHSILHVHGKIILTVPAFQWLWSRADICGHKRRYTIKTLKDVVSKAGFTIHYARYFFAGILPLLLLRHFLHPAKETFNEQNELKDEFVINPILNRILLLLTRCENKLSPLLPNLPGGSIIMVAEKE